MTFAPLISWREQLKSHGAFVLVPLIVATLVATDQYSSPLIPISFWSTIGMAEIPYKMTILVSVLAVLAAIVFYFASQADDVYVLLIILAVIGLQTNGIKIVPNVLDLITALPFFVILLLIAEALRRPSFQIVLPGVMFFALLLLLLDLPYLMMTVIYGPFRFIINFISILKAVLVAFVFVNVIRTEHHLETAIRAIVVVAVVSALIGLIQVALAYFFGILLSFTSEEGAWKPNFLGLPLRATALTTWGSWLSDFLVLALPFMLFRLFGAQNGWWRGAYVAAILIVLGTIVLTFTYAAYFAAALIFLLFPFVYWPQRTLHFVAALLLSGVLFYTVGGFEWAFEHGLSKVTSSTGMIERRTYLLAAVNELARDPWLGSGVYADEQLSENFYRKRVHNAGLQAWVYFGLPGLLVFITMMLTVLTQVWLLAVSARQRADRQLFQALGLGVFAMILNMFAEPNLTHPITWYYVGLCQAAILVYGTYRYPRPAYAARQVPVLHGA